MRKMRNRNYDFDDALDRWDLPVFRRRNPETHDYTSPSPLYISALLHYIYIYVYVTRYYLLLCTSGVLW
jgi:hypothetical protein